MNPAEKAWRAAVDASHVLTRVEARLVAAGALIELRQLQGLSAQEVDVLVWQETHEPIVRTNITDAHDHVDPQAEHSDSPNKSTVLPSPASHPRAEVAA